MHNKLPNLKDFEATAVLKEPQLSAQRKQKGYECARNY